MWYAVYDTATGELKSAGSVVADPLPSGLASKEYAERPHGLGWNPETLDFDVPRPTPATELSPVEFMQLFTVSERIEIKGAGDPVIDDFFDLVRVAGTIRMDHPMVEQGLKYLVRRGILTTERATEIGGA
mgnify:CR=1 FL=1